MLQPLFYIEANWWRSMRVDC